MTGTTSSRPPKRTPVEKGFGSFADIIPADVYAAVQALELEITEEASGEITVRCPAHLERTGRVDHDPSFNINLESGKNFCFSCKFGGKFADLVAYVQEVDRGQAVAWIKTRGVGAAVMRALEPAPEKVGPTKISEASLALFTLPPAVELAKRRISAEAAEACEILWDPARKAWITPIRHPKTHALMGWQAKRGKHVRNRPLGVEKRLTLFGIQRPSTDDVIVLESPLDTAVLLTAGIPGAVATFGSHISREQLDLLAIRGRRLISFFDDDEAGWIATEHLVDAMRPRGKPVAVVGYGPSCPPGADPGDLCELTLLKQVQSAIPSALYR